MSREPERFGLRVPVVGERSVELSYSVLDTAPVGMAITTPEGDVAWANAALAHMVGLSTAELVEKGLAAVVDPEEREADRQAARRVVAGEQDRYHLEQRWWHTDGTGVWVAVTGSLATDPDGEPLVFEDGGRPALVRQVVDATARRKAEEAASEAYALLELRHAELERSNEELAEFSYAVSHDLSEPLRVISGHVQLLAQRYQGQLDDEADTWIGFAVDGCKRMRTLIDDLLAYSRVGRGGRPIEPVDLGAVAREAVADAATLVDQAGADIEIGTMPDDLPGDRTELTRVVSNLVTNGVKYRRDDVPCRVRVTSERLDGEVLITVADNGIGIPERHRARIFRPFQRLHGRDEYPGTGMGLTIARKAVLRMGGQIGVEDTPGGGTTIWFTIPAEEAPRGHT